MNKALEQFRAIPLVRSFISLDEATGDLIRHEVRRDPQSRLTLTASFPVLAGKLRGE